MPAKPTDVPAAEAVEIRPSQPGDPKADVHVYPPGRAPALWIYTAGQWCRAAVQGRYTVGRRVDYQVDIYIDSGPGRGHFIRTYRWGDPAVRVAYGPARK